MLEQRVINSQHSGYYRLTPHSPHFATLMFALGNTDAVQCSAIIAGGKAHRLSPYTIVYDMSIMLLHMHAFIYLPVFRNTLKRYIIVAIISSNTALSVYRYLYTCMMRTLYICTLSLLLYSRIYNIIAYTMLILGKYVLTQNTSRSLKLTGRTNGMLLVC